MTLRHLPPKCEHGHDIHKHFKGLDDANYDPSKPVDVENNENVPNVFFLPDCRDSQKAMRAHIVLPSWPEDTARYGTYELERGAGRRTKKESS